MTVQDVGIRTVAEVAAARAVVVAYHAAIDRGRASTASPLFTEDAYFEVKGKGLRGRDEIAEFLRTREAQTDRHTVHLITSERVERADADEVELSSFVLLYLRGVGGYTLDRVLDTRHVLRRTTAGWLVAHRTSRPLHAPSDRDDKETA